MNQKVLTVLLFLSIKCFGQENINLIPFSSTAICEGSTIPVYFDSNLPSGTQFTAQLKKNGAVVYGINGTTSPINIPFHTTLFIQASVEVIGNGNIKSQESELLSIGKPTIYLTDNIKRYNSSNFIQLCQGTSKILEVEITDGSNKVTFNNPITYQWKKDNVIIPNATSLSFEISETGYYHCEITNQNCTYLSATVRVFFTTPQGFSNYLDNIDIEGQEFECIGKVKKIKANYNSQNTNYELFRNDTLIQSNSNNREFNIDKSGRYRIKILDKNCIINSEYKKITFSNGLYSPIITNHNDTIICGAGGSFNNISLYAPLVNCDFSNYYSYEWQDNKIKVLPQISGYAGGTSCYLTTLISGNFRVLYKREDCVSASKEIEIKGNANQGQKPQISLKNGFETCSTISNVASSNNGVKIDSDNGYVFWYKNGVSLNRQYPFYVAHETGIYKAIRITGCTEESNEIVIDFENKINKPKIIVENEKYNLCGPNDFTRIIFDIQNLGTQSGLNIKYYRNGVNFSSGSAGTNGSNPFRNINQSGTYYVEVYNGDCFTRSNTIEITQGLPSINIINETDIISCSNSLVKLKLNGILNDDLGKVKWYKDDIEIPYEYDNFIYQNKAGIYKATYNNNTCIAISQNFNLNVIDVPNRLDSSIYKINVKDEISINARGCNGNINWYNSKYDLNSIFNGNTLLVNNLASNKSYFISCEKDGCSSLLRSEIKVNVCETNATINSGNFKNPNIWSCGLIPNKYSNVVISSGNHIIIDEKFSIKSLINNGEIEIDNNGEIEIFHE